MNNGGGSVHVLLQGNNESAPLSKHTLQIPDGRTLSVENLTQLVEIHAGEFITTVLGDTVIAHIYDAPVQQSVACVHTLSLSTIGHRLPALCLLANRLGNGRILHIFGWVRLSVVEEEDIEGTTKVQDKVHFTIGAAPASGHRLVIDCNTTQLSNEWKRRISIESFGFIHEDPSPTPSLVAAEEEDLMMVEAVEVVETAAVAPPPFTIPTIAQVDAEQLLPHALSTLAAGSATSITAPPSHEALLCFMWLLYPKMNWKREDLLAFLAEMMPVDFAALYEGQQQEVVITCTPLRQLAILVLEKQLIAATERLNRQLPLAHLQNLSKEGGGGGDDVRHSERMLVKFHDIQQRACRWFLSIYNAIRTAARLQHGSTGNSMLLCYQQDPPTAMLAATLQEIATYDGFADYRVDNSSSSSNGSANRRAQRYRNFSVDNAAAARIHIELEGEEGNGESLELVDPVYASAPQCLQRLIKILEQTQHLHHSQMNMLVPAVYHFFRHQRGCTRDRAFGRTIHWFQQYGVTLMSPSNRPPGDKADKFPYKAYTLLMKRMMIDTDDPKVPPKVQIESSCYKVIPNVAGGEDSVICPFRSETKNLSSEIKRSATSIEDLCMYMCLRDYQKDRKISVEARAGMPSMRWLHASVK